MGNGLPWPCTTLRIVGAAWVGLGIAGVAEAGGISAYLRADLPPFQARQLDTLFALADQPVLRRPIPVTMVEDALSRACARDPGLCESMQRWLRRFREPAAVTGLELEAALADDTHVALPNRHGEHSGDHWQLSASAQWQPASHVLLAAGAIARKGEVVPT